MSWMDWAEIIADVGLNLYGADKAQDAAEDTRKVNMEDIMRLMAEGDRYNNPNTFGVFGGWQNQMGPDGRLTQTQLVNPQMQEGINKFIGDFNQGGEDPQMQGLQNALYERTLNRFSPSPMPKRRDRKEYVDDEGNRLRGY